MRAGAVFIALMFILLAIGCQTGPDLSKITPTPTPDPKAPPAEKEISGGYELEGKDETGAVSYSGALTVSNLGNSYRLDWQTNKERYNGIGVQLADNVAATYDRSGPGRGCGVALYLIGEDGSLNGRIAKWGETSFGTETAIKTEGRNFDGKYSVAGVRADGSTYEGTLEVIKNGGGYQFVWQTGERLVGYGIWRGGYAAISFGGNECSFSLFKIKPNGDLDGFTGGQASFGFGTEVAVRK